MSQIIQIALARGVTADSFEAWGGVVEQGQRACCWGASGLRYLLTAG
jgi:hypothetical protein